MGCSAKYLEESIFYEPWKTKFIESFCPLYAKLKIKSRQNLTTEEYKNFVFLFFNVYKLALNILQRKLLSEYNTKLKFYSDVIHVAKKYELISDERIFFDMLDFVSKCNFNKENVFNFDNQYLLALDSFHKQFKQLSMSGGIRNKNYVFYDNSSCIWGIDEKWYNCLINLFLEFDSLKIVRIFGSRVTLNYSTYSDIDLICEGLYSQLEFIQIREKIRNYESPYIMDVYDINHTNKAFLYRNLIRSNIFYKRQDYVNDEYNSKFITKKAT